MNHCLACYINVREAHEFLDSVQENEQDVCDHHRKAGYDDRLSPFPAWGLKSVCLLKFASI